MGELNQREVREILTRLYKGILNREPDPDGFNSNYNIMLKSPNWDGVENMIKTFVSSQEFRILRGETIRDFQQPAVDYMAWDEIGKASEAWLVAGGAPGSPYDEFRGKYLPRPDWFDSGLDPFSSKYADQQDRLWHLMIGEQKHYDGGRHAERAPLAEPDDLRGQPIN